MYSASSFPSPGRLLLIDGSKFCEQCLKRVSQATLLWNYFKIWPMVQEKIILKELLKKFQLVTIATRVFDEIKFCEQILKRTSQGTFLPSLVWIGPVIWEMTFKKTVDAGDEWQTQNRSKSSPENVVLKWAKNHKYWMQVPILNCTGLICC